MEQSEREEMAMLAAAKYGDKAAFGYLVRQYQRRAYATAYSYVGNRDDALDLAQDGFVRAFRAMHRFDLRMPFYPWLHRIVRNVCLNHLKKRKRAGESSLDAMTEHGFDAEDDGRLPDGEAALGDLRGRIREALAVLSDEHREIIRLRHYLELSYREIAEVLDIPQGTVMSRLYAARKNLKEALEAQEAEATEDVPA